MSDWRIIAEISSADGWAGLVEGFRKAHDARNTTYECTSELAGLPTRYVNKILAPIPIKNIGPKSLGPLMGALAVKILIVEDAEMLAALSKRFVARKHRRRRDALEGMPQKKRHKWRRFGSIPAERQILHSHYMLFTTAKQRITWARRAAKARWARRPGGDTHLS